MSKQALLLCVSTDVTVSVPAMLNIGEGGGMVQVCVTLSAVEDTERNFAISLATSDGTGSYNFRYKLCCI